MLKINKKTESDTTKVLQLCLIKILRYIKSIFCRPKYYSEEYGWYNVVNVKFRTDYFKADALIVTDNGMWYNVPYVWLMDNSIDENGRPAKINNKYI